MWVIWNSCMKRRTVIYTGIAGIIGGVVGSSTTIVVTGGSGSTAGGGDAFTSSANTTDENTGGSTEDTISYGGAGQVVEQTFAAAEQGDISRVEELLYLESPHHPPDDEFINTMSNKKLVRVENPVDELVRLEPTLTKQKFAQRRENLKSEYNIDEVGFLMVSKGENKNEPATVVKKDGVWKYYGN